ncbi:MAG TPA: DUF3307 domain-containing protein [Rhizomicrobium sp.]
MGQETALVLGALLAFQIKHFLADFVLQTAYQVRTKGIYGHAGGLMHAGIHILGTIPVLVYWGASAGAAAIVLIGEFVVHYHMDWLKANIDRIYQWGMQSQRFWMLFGFDQLVHQLTYLGIVYVLAAGMIA